MARKKLTAALVQKAGPPPSGQAQYEIWDTEVPGMSLRIGRGKRRSYYATVRICGRARRFKLGDHPDISLKTAREVAREVRADACQGIDQKDREVQRRRETERARLNTFGAVASEFIEDYAKKAAPRSWPELQRKIDADLNPNWRDTPVASLTRQDVRRLIRQKARRSPVSANRLLTLANQIFAWAIREDLMEVSPAVGITPEAETPRDRVLSDDEIEAVWRAFETEGYPYGPLFKLMLVTAQRRGEVSGIKRSEIEGDTWRLPGARTKGGAGHLVPLSSLALEIVHSLPDLGDHLFTSGRRLDEKGNFSDKPVIAFRKAKTRCDLVSQVQDWRLHDLRRTAATNMRKLGVDRLTV